ncbi:hypothetical protein ELQ88_07580 [Pseudomonas sp. MPC6]|nr:hypothetical protein ELQ88_07580 [Pseudomonas sp. MPC6]
MLAMVVNDNAPNLNECGALTFLTSKLAPTMSSGRRQLKPKPAVHVKCRAFSPWEARFRCNPR